MMLSDVGEVYIENNLVLGTEACRRATLDAMYHMSRRQCAHSMFCHSSMTGTNTADSETADHMGEQPRVIDTIKSWG